MPSTSAKQHRFMEAVAHSPEFAKKAGVPQSVGRDFVAADKRAAAGPHREPDADERGGRSDMDRDDRMKCPKPMHKSHDAPTRCPTPQHGSHDMPTRPGQRQGGY